MSQLTWLVQRLTWLSLLDILLVAAIIYGLLTILRRTQAVLVLRGLIIVAILAILMTSLLPLPAFTWLIRNSLPALLVAIPVIFQPELRRALERLGRAGPVASWFGREVAMDLVVEEVADACVRLGERRHGALIVFERETGLQDVIDTGVLLDAEVSSELLLTIFYPNTALHDQAVVIRADRIAAASCVLPLSERLATSHVLGTRHKAGIGVTERSDAVSVIVSEETGIISIAHNGRMIRRLDGERLRNILKAFFAQSGEITLASRLRGAFPGNSRRSRAA
ncbi:MAG: TIGR00159 family protein [Anaerolineae bacterium]|nr:TIGR00159 family protein [Anaerolineae bacterium]